MVANGMYIDRFTTLVHPNIVASYAAKSDLLRYRKEIMPHIIMHERVPIEFIDSRETTHKATLSVARVGEQLFYVLEDGAEQRQKHAYIYRTAVDVHKSLRSGKLQGAGCATVRINGNGSGKNLCPIVKDSLLLLAQIRKDNNVQPKHESGGSYRGDATHA